MEGTDDGAAGFPKRSETEGGSDGFVYVDNVEGRTHQQPLHARRDVYRKTEARHGAVDPDCETVPHRDHRHPGRPVQRTESLRSHEQLGKVGVGRVLGEQFQNPAAAASKQSAHPLQLMRVVRGSHDHRQMASELQLDGEVRDMLVDRAGRVPSKGSHQGDAQATLHTYLLSHGPPA